MTDDSHDADDSYDAVRAAAANAETAAVAKQAVDASQELGLEQGLEHESPHAFQLFATDDKDEGIDAFLEDREPSFEGR